jgi:hypothetical protein
VLNVVDTLCLVGVSLTGVAHVVLPANEAGRGY